MAKGSTNDSTTNNNNNRETAVIFLKSSSNSYHFDNIKPIHAKDSEQNNNNENKKQTDLCQTSNKLNTCNTLQRKLEMKVERAKRNYSQFNNNQPKVNVRGNEK